MLPAINNTRKIVTNIFGFMLAAFAIYGAGPSEPMNEGTLRGILILVGGVIVILSTPLKVTLGRFALNEAVALALDIFLMLALLLSIYTFFQIQEELWEGIFILKNRELWIGLMGTLVLVELTRRVFGGIMASVCLLSFFYAYIGPSLPGFLAHAGLSFEETMRSVWFSFDGVFGFPVGVVGSVVLIFIVFGAILEGTGAGAALLKLASAVTGGIRGGPAHAAIVSSAIFGTISGNPVANVVGTGVFTIPLIKKQGFRPEFAGAVEAAASTGGQFTPPIMGAVAFVMADLLDLPYLQIAIAAMLPALLYYCSLFMTVYVEAGRQNIAITPVDQREKMELIDWVNCLRFFLPLVIIVTTMVVGRSPAAAGFYGLITAIIIACSLDRKLINNPLPIIKSLTQGGIQSARLLVAVGAIGILVSIINTTGFGISFAGQLSSVAESSIGVALMVAAIGSLILGMGLPTLPSYLFIVLMIGPAITKMGVEPLQAHMFVLYFGVMSNVTPPFALAAFAAAPIADARPIATAIASSSVSLAGYLVPFLFIFYPSILLVTDSFNYFELVSVLVRGVIMIWLAATALAGYEWKKLGIFNRLMRFGLAILCIYPVMPVHMTAGVLGATIVLFGLMSNNTRKADGIEHSEIV